MRREIRRRLEKALITLQEPNGSTIRSIIKVINKEAPILSLRKVLEALQEGINEGFLCMYNGRFKLKQQIPTGKSFREDDVFDSDDCLAEERDTEEIPRNFDDEVYDDESDLELEKKRQLPLEGKGKLFSLAKERGKKIHFEKLSKRRKNISSSRKNHSSVEEKDKRRRRAPRNNVKSKSNYKNKGKSRKRSKRFTQATSEHDDVEPTSAMEHLSTNCGVSQKPITEKPDLKRQRGPRCTSMKKDVRMPSKVQIPFMLPTVPQKSSTFNELLRRSPNPVNGPLFEDYNNFSFKPDKLEFFKAYC